jgi:hypothetical protein
VAVAGAVPIIAKMGIGQLCELIFAGGGVHGGPLATSRAVVRVADVQSA